MDSEDEEDDFKPEKLPIYRKGKEIFAMVHKVADLIPEDNEYLMEVKSQMLCDAALLFVEVAGAEAGGLYDLRMENATNVSHLASHNLFPASCYGVSALYICPVIKTKTNEKRRTHKKVFATTLFPEKQ